MGIFDNVSKHDLLNAFRNQGRKVKRRTCNSNGTRYTMNQILHGNATSNGKKTDHRYKDKKVKPKSYLLHDGTGWVKVELTKKQVNRLRKNKTVTIQVIEKQALYAHEIKD